MNKVYLVQYKVNGEWKKERISSPDIYSAESSWKNYRKDIPYTSFCISLLEGI